jgi:hypothetical protein
LRRVRSDLEEHGAAAERLGLVPHAIVERAADAAGLAARRGDEVEEREVEIRGMAHEREAAHPAARRLGYEDDRTESGIRTA